MPEFIDAVAEGWTPRFNIGDNVAYVGTPDELLGKIVGFCPDNPDYNWRGNVIYQRPSFGRYAADRNNRKIDAVHPSNLVIWTFSEEYEAIIAGDLPLEERILALSKLGR